MHFDKFTAKQKIKMKSLFSADVMREILKNHI